MGNMHKHIRTASLLTVLTALLAGFVGLSVSPAQALGTYNATNAANWAESNWNKPPGNLDNPGNDGQCISFVGDALNQGFGTSFQWAGIQQMINL
mgnify:FL=1